MPMSSAWAVLHFSERSHSESQHLWKVAGKVVESLGFGFESGISFFYVCHGQIIELSVP